MARTLPPPAAPRSSTAPASPISTAPPAEDFLYHLYRGSEMLLDNRVHEAKDELERALRLQPQDAKGQDLLAAVYYRLGMLDRAEEIYRTLIAEHPAEPSLHANLALVHYKRGELSPALDELRTAVELRPDDRRAQNTLGLVYAKLGDLERARDAFLHGGQTSVAERLDKVQKGLLPRSLLDNIEDLVKEARQAVDVRRAASAAFREVDTAENPFSHAESRPIAATVPAQPWQPVELASGAPPRERPTLADVTPPRPTEAWAKERMLDVAAGVPGAFAVDSRGTLLVRTDGTARCRLEGLVVVVGEFQTETTPRRQKGRTTAEPFLGIQRVLGGGWLAIDPSGGRFTALAVSEDAVYLREEFVFGFDEGLAWENGRVPGPEGTAAMPLAHFRGRGTVVLKTTAELRTLALTSERPIAVPPQKLVGWIGRILPRSGPAGAGEAPDATSWLDLCSFSGEGLVLVVGG